MPDICACSGRLSFFVHPDLSPRRSDDPIVPLPWFSVFGGVCASILALCCAAMALL